MARFSMQWPLLRGAVLVFAMAVSLSVAMSYGSDRYLQKMHAAYQQQNAKLNGVTELYRTAMNDQALYNRYVKRYRELEDKGVIGQESRLSWVEALEAANKKLTLSLLEYEIAPQQVLPLDTAQSGSGIMTLQRSSMRLKANLLHEVDLFALLVELRDRTGGRFEVRECVLQRLRDTLVIERSAANFNAICSLYWYTLRVAGQAAGAGGS